jgi:hypothetical protein
MVDALTLWPSLSSSPWILLYPQPSFSMAALMGIAAALNEGSVRAFSTAARMLSADGVISSEHDPSLRFASGIRDRFLRNLDDPIEVVVGEDWASTMPDAGIAEAPVLHEGSPDVSMMPVDASVDVR